MIWISGDVKVFEAGKRVFTTPLSFYMYPGDNGQKED